MKMMRKLSVLMMAVMMLSCVALVAYADEEAPSGKFYKYGVYEPEKTELYDSGKVKILCNRVHLTTEAIAEISFTSVKYTKAMIGDKEYAPYVDEEAGTSTFLLPVKLNEAFTFTAHTTAMGGKDIDYENIIVELDEENLKPATVAYKDGFYTTAAPTNIASYGYKTDKSGKVSQIGTKYPNKNYNLPVTVQVEGGKVVDVFYPVDITGVTVNTSSDFNYLIWGMDGHQVSDGSYEYLTDGSYSTYHLDPMPVRNDKGMAEQIISKNGITGVDTVSKATITSRAIIDSVDQSLIKAARGEKDDPAPEKPQEDTSDDVIPADGYYTATGDCIGADLGEDKDILLEVKDGKITAKLLYIEQRESAYPHIFAGTEKETLEAGETAWLSPENYDYGNRSSKGLIYPGSIYKDVPIKSLDKNLHFMMFASSSDTWYNRMISIDSDTLEAITEKEAEGKLAVAEMETKLCDAMIDTQNAEAAQAEAEKAKGDAEKAKAEAEAAQKEAEKAVAELEKEVETAKSETGADKKAIAEAEKKIAELTVKAAQVKGVKAKKGKKKATVSWKKLGAGYKYEVFVSTKVNKGFKKKATSAKLKAVVKKLKSKKTYYVKVRAFKKVNGKKVYTGYSDIASVKVK